MHFNVGALVIHGGDKVGTKEHAHKGTRPIRDAIAAAYAVFEEAFFKGDADTIAEVYTEDAEWFVPDAPVIRGKKAIAEAWKGNVGSGGNALQIDTLEVEESGTLAYEVGRFTARAPGGATLFAGKYIVIWKLQPNGDWKTYRDIFNWDIAPQRE
jgi:uncharacterized protein (TIGR02246 family)